MSDLYGVLRGNRSQRESTRCADHFLIVTAACWRGAIRTTLSRDPDTRIVTFDVSLVPWGTMTYNQHDKTLASGLLDSQQVTVHAPADLA